MDSILDQVVRLVFDVAAVAIAPLAIVLVAKLLQRVGLTLDAEKRAKLEKLTQDAILATEEWAAARAKAGLEKVIPAEKLHRAVRHLLDQVPGISTDEATRLINQELPKIRASAAGFFAATREAVTK